MSVQKLLGGAGNMISNDGTISQRLACCLQNVLEGQVICRGITGLDHSAWIGVPVWKWLGGAGNLLRNDGTISQRLACRFENGL